MTKNDKIRLLYLEKRITRLRAEFCGAQAELERLVEAHGMCSLEAGRASVLCGDLALRISETEEELNLIQWRR